MTHETDIAWLAGIIDGEGCFSVKNPVKRGTGRTCHQVWLVICNTSERMIVRCADIIERLGAKRPTIRRVWKGKKATRWQFWLDVCGKENLLRVTKAVLSHLTAKRIEGEVIKWFLTRACGQRAYRRTDLDIAVLNTLSEVKLLGGEASAQVADLLRVVIPSQALEGTSAKLGSREGVETRSVSPSDNPTHERPTTSTVVEAGDIVRHSDGSRRVSPNSSHN